MIIRLVQGYTQTFTGATSLLEYSPTFLHMKLYFKSPPLFSSAIIVSQHTDDRLCLQSGCCCSLFTGIVLWAGLQAIVPADKR